MDDIVTVNCPRIQKYIELIYPIEFVNIEPTLINSMMVDSRVFVTKIVYLNLEISLLGPFLGEYRTRFTWKRDFFAYYTI